MVERIKKEILRRKAAADKQAQNINGLEVYYIGKSDLCSSLLDYIDYLEQMPCLDCKRNIPITEQALTKCIDDFKSKCGRTK